MRDSVTSALEVAGLALVSCGFFVLSPALGLMAAGGALILVGMAEGRQ